MPRELDEGLLLTSSPGGNVRRPCKRIYVLQEARFRIRPGRLTTRTRCSGALRCLRRHSNSIWIRCLVRLFCCVRGCGCARPLRRSSLTSSTSAKGNNPRGGQHVQPEFFEIQRNVRHDVEVFNNKPVPEQHLVHHMRRLVHSFLVVVHHVTNRSELHAGARLPYLKVQKVTGLALVHGEQPLSPLCWACRGFLRWVLLVHIGDDVGARWCRRIVTERLRAQFVLERRELYQRVFGRVEANVLPQMVALQEGVQLAELLGVVVVQQTRRLELLQH
mmetsp:Transcript_1246/g.2755  ORF Transcript_1246/g.2755 Transcript_1246/m.2755 type:complete len:275 (-) Transcript_1246:383-1207(-)